MSLRRTTTIRFAALATLLTVLPWAANAHSGCDDASCAGTVRTTSAITAPMAASVPLPSAPATDSTGSTGSTDSSTDTATDVSPSTPTVAAKPLRVTRSFFWMNAMRSNLDWRARVTAADRMRTDVAHMREDKTDLGVLAEVAADQRADFRRLGGKTWAMVAGGNQIDNVVVYRRTAFTQVARSTMTTRYNDGLPIHVNIPVLRDNVTGTLVAVIPVHNPQWHAGPWRTVSLRLEMAKIRQLRRTHRDWQIVIAGDFNAAASSACGLMGLGLASAQVDRRHCNRVRAIDQMYATPRLQPHAYRSVRTTATDHLREYHARLRF